MNSWPRCAGNLPKRSKALSLLQHQHRQRELALVLVQALVVLKVMTHHSRMCCERKWRRCGSPIERCGCVTVVHSVALLSVDMVLPHPFVVCVRVQQLQEMRAEQEEVEKRCERKEVYWKDQLTASQQRYLALQTQHDHLRRKFEHVAGGASSSGSNAGAGAGAGST